MRYRATLVALLLQGCGADPIDVPPGFPALPYPEDNEPTAARVDLGRRLFHDAQLSRTRDISCASCHLQEHAFADPVPVSIGVHGRTGTRNAPPLFNLAWNTSFFWDGGAPTLEHQVIGPLTNPVEMDITMDEVVGRLTSDASYTDAFREAYGGGASPGAVTKALASFLRSLVSGGSRYDRFTQGDEASLTVAERRGMDLFFSERAECFHCHVGFNFTNNGFHNNGTHPDDPDPGRAAVTERSTDEGRFKVPSLRNVAVTAPYLHDGSLATLEDVVEHYRSGGQGHPNTDPTLHPLDLSDEEASDLVAFLRSLTDEAFLADPRHAPSVPR